MQLGPGNSVGEIAVTLIEHPQLPFR
jgi:hypothetical protein